CSRDQSGFDYW
nr:immunoglobulin heavy chain junction region [Macaca mulatta]